MFKKSTGSQDLRTEAFGLELDNKFTCQDGDPSLPPPFYSNLVFAKKDEIGF